MPVAKKEEPKVEVPKEPVAVEQKEYLRAGRPDGRCSGCGSRLMRPSKPDNSTWRCQKYILGEATPACQRGIKREVVLDEKEVVEVEVKRKERHKLEDIG